MRSREIKFRGLSKRNKTYVYGSYWLNPFTKQNFIRTLCEGGTQLEDIECLVVEQFTGLVDINGKEIYAGDIVTAYVKNRGGTISYGNDKAVVKWIDKKGGFYYVADLIGRYMADKKPFQVTHKINSYKVQVIGNIHENKDLLA